MRPRSFERGKQKLFVVYIQNFCPASMRPRSFERGKILAEVEKDTFDRASMRPRSFERGKEEIKKAYHKASTLLQ